MVGIIRLYDDRYGDTNSKIFCELSKYFKGVIITGNDKILKLKNYKSISYNDAIRNVKKFNKLIVVDSDTDNYYHWNIKQAIYLILNIKQLFFFSSDDNSLQRLIELHHTENLESAVQRLNNNSIKLNTTDFIHFFGTKERKVNFLGEKKFYTGYFGPVDHHHRVKELFHDLSSKVIIGEDLGEVLDYPWFVKNKNYLDYISLCYTTPIIDDKLDKVYEIWHTNTIALLDSNIFNIKGLDESFYFKGQAEFHAKTLIISNQRNAYTRMLSIQKKLLTKLKTRYGKSTFNWSSILKRRKLEEQAKLAHIEKLKQDRVKSAMKRLKLNNVNFEK